MFPITIALYMESHFDRLMLALKPGRAEARHFAVCAIATGTGVPSSGVCCVVRRRVRRCSADTYRVAEVEQLFRFSGLSNPLVR